MHTSFRFSSFFVAMCYYPKASQQCVHPTWGTRRVFKRFSWLEVGSGKLALPRPTPSGYRLLHLSRAEINLTGSSSTRTKKTRSVDRVQALRQIFCFQRLIFSFYGNASPPPSADPSCRGCRIYHLAIQVPVTCSNQVPSSVLELRLLPPTSLEHSCAQSV
jgi:hypothetical protein